MKFFDIPAEYVDIKEAKLKIGSMKDEFKIIEFVIHNTLSQITEISLLVLCKKIVKEDSIIGKDAIFELKYPNLSLEYDLYVEEVESMIYPGHEISSPYITKALKLFNKLNKLKDNLNSRVYESGGPKEILEALFKPYNFKIQIKVITKDRRIVCQYNESDYDFFCRVCHFYQLGYYYDNANKVLVIHDGPSYGKNFQGIKNVPYKSLIKAAKSKIIYSTREKWSINKIKGEYSPQSSNSIRGYFLEGCGNASLLKNITEHKGIARNKPLIQYKNLMLPLYAGARIEGKIVYKFYLAYLHNQQSLISEVTCINSGLEIPEFNDTRGPIISAGLTQAKPNQVTENQNVISEENNETPVKMLFDDKRLIKARQTYMWLGKFYGSHFPIREQTEVLVMFVDSLMSVPYIVSCYSNASNSAILAKDEVGIKTASITTTSTEKYMNQLIFKDKKGSELTRLSGKKDLQIDTKEAIKIDSEKTIDVQTENMTTNISKSILFKVKKDYNIEAENFNVKVQKQEVKSETDYKIEAPQQINITSKKIQIGDGTLEIKVKSMKISADKLEIKASVFDLQADVWKAKVKSLELQAQMLKLQSKVLQLQSDMNEMKLNLLKVEGKAIIIDAKFYLVMAKAIMLQSNAVIVG